MAFRTMCLGIRFVKIDPGLYVCANNMYKYTCIQIKSIT